VGQQTRAEPADKEATTADGARAADALAHASVASGVAALQRTIGNRAVASLLQRRRRLIAREVSGKPQEGALIARPSDGAIFEILSSSFDKDLGTWSYKVRDTSNGAAPFVIAGGNKTYEFSSGTQQVEAALADPKADFNAVVDRIPEGQLNAMSGFNAWLAKILPAASAERFAYLAASIMLVSRYAPAGRKEALRLISAMLQDKDVALRMILKPVKAVIVPRDKAMTELDEFRSLLTSDSGKGPGKTFDGREWAHVRGVGNVTVGTKVYAAITEENLLGGAPDAKVFDAPKNEKGEVVGSKGTPGGSYTVGYSTTTHEFAHVLHRQGLSDDQKKIITKHYAAKKAATTGKDGLVKNVWPDGPRVNPTAPKSWTDAGWTDEKRIEHLAGLADDARRVYENYSSQNEAEYFAQMANAYVGTNLGTDPTTGRPRNNGRAWIEANEPKEMLDLLDQLFKNVTVNDIEAGGALKAGGKCTNPAPKPEPAPAGTPPGKPT
jgi:hypothetical protein